MKKILLVAAVLSISTLAFGQSMMKSAAGSSGGTGSMMSSNAMSADPKVGSELRFATSTGHKVIFTDIEAAENAGRQGADRPVLRRGLVPVLPGGPQGHQRERFAAREHHDRRRGLRQGTGAGEDVRSDRPGHLRADRRHGRPACRLERRRGGRDSFAREARVGGKS